VLTTEQSLEPKCFKLALEWVDEWRHCQAQQSSHSLTGDMLLTLAVTWTAEYSGKWS